MTLSIIGKVAGPVLAGAPPHLMDGVMMDISYMMRPSIVATHSYKEAPALDVLLVPGGIGNLLLEQANDTWVEDFIGWRYPQLDYLLSVCTGSMSLAKSGVLNGKKATTNKSAWNTVVANGHNVTWMPSARWTQDGKVWTSSGVSAGELKVSTAYPRKGDSNEVFT